MRDRTPEGSDIDGRICTGGLKLRLIPELIVEPLGKQEDRGGRSDEHIAARRDIERSATSEQSHGLPGQRILEKRSCRGTGRQSAAAQRAGFIG